MASNGGVSCFLKLFFGTLAVMGFICVLLAGTLETQGGSTKTATSTAVAPESFSEKPADVVGKENKLVHPELDLNYMSKRRVPNGPDPIHNRRAGNSGRPPGQA